MRLLENPELKKVLILCLCILAATAGIGFFAFGPAAGALVLGTGVCFMLVLFFVTRARYREIVRLSEHVDDILNDVEGNILQDTKEGELAVLESEIHKMSIRLRDQASSLKKDKIYLTDAIADISHQLRTPLTTINIIMSMLKRNMDMPVNERRKNLQTIDLNLLRIDWLISSLLKMAKIDAGTAAFQREPVDLKELVDQSVESLLVPMELKDQTFLYEAKGGESYLGDFNWSREAVCNIIKNCMEHTPEGGTITVTAQENELFTELIIRDNGPGISRKDMPYLFERFYKGENSGENSVGIGLAMSRMIIKEQNGTIRADNNAEGGARFTIRIYRNEQILKS